jgi:cytochrome c553
VIRQLQNFRSGVRGSDPADTYGQQMASMGALLPNSDTVDKVAAFVGNFTFTRARAAAPGAGNSARGASLYQSCSACHGTAAEGSVALGAPPLVGQDSSYLLRQLEGFKNSRRGGPRDSRWGQQMGAAAASLPDDKSMNDVVAYIATIRDPP